MKRIINMLLGMVYPMLISLFIYGFAEAFISERDFREPLQTATVIMAIVFGAMFIAGVIWNIVYSVKHKDEHKDE